MDSMSSTLTLAAHTFGICEHRCRRVESEKRIGPYSMSFLCRWLPTFLMLVSNVAGRSDLGARGLLGHLFKQPDLLIADIDVNTPSFCSLWHAGKTALCQLCELHHAWSASCIDSHVPASFADVPAIQRQDTDK